MDGIGYKMLIKMGWDEKSQLGKKSGPYKEPVLPKDTKRNMYRTRGVYYFGLGF